MPYYKIDVITYPLMSRTFINILADDFPGGCIDG